jgi:hypothetical protein
MAYHACMHNTILIREQLRFFTEFWFDFLPMLFADTCGGLHPWCSVCTYGDMLHLFFYFAFTWLVSRCFLSGASNLSALIFLVTVPLFLCGPIEAERCGGGPWSLPEISILFSSSFFFQPRIYM